MTNIFCLCIAVLPYVHPNEGWLSAYDQRPTDATIAYYQDVGMLPDDLVGPLIAVYDCWRIGQTVTIHTYDGLTLEATIFDCAGAGDGGQDWMQRHNYVGELDYYTALMYPEYIGTWAKVKYYE